MSGTSTSSPHPHLSLVLDYLRAIERDVSEDELSAFFAPGVKQHEFPNRLVERGAERGLDQLLEGSRKGRLVVQNQRYVVHSTLVEGDRVAVELTWSAELKVPLGKLEPGQTMTAHCGFFFRVQDGRIAAQHNYDCFEPF
jgi:ketosteroid isomerase-like protein